MICISDPERYTHVVQSRFVLVTVLGGLSVTMIMLGIFAPTINGRSPEPFAISGLSRSNPTHMADREIVAPVHRRSTVALTGRMVEHNAKWATGKNLLSNPATLRRIANRAP